MTDWKMIPDVSRSCWYLQTSILWKFNFHHFSNACHMDSFARWAGPYSSNFEVNLSINSVWLISRIHLLALPIYIAFIILYDFAESRLQMSAQNWSKSFRRYPKIRESASHQEDTQWSIEKWSLMSPGHAGTFKPQFWENSIFVIFQTPVI